MSQRSTTRVPEALALRTSTTSFIPSSFSTFWDTRSLILALFADPSSLENSLLQVGQFVRIESCTDSEEEEDEDDEEEERERG